MKRKNIRDTPVVKVYDGYDLEEVIDTDDTGYDHGESTIAEEVKLDFERAK